MDQLKSESDNLKTQLEDIILLNKNLRSRNQMTDEKSEV